MDQRCAEINHWVERPCYFKPYPSSLLSTPPGTHGDCIICFKAVGARPPAPRPSRHSSPLPSFQPPNRHSRAEPAPGSIGGGNPRRHPSQGPTPLPSFQPRSVIPAPKPSFQPLPSFPRRACPRLDRGRESTPPPIPRPHAPPVIPAPSRHSSPQTVIPAQSLPPARSGAGIHAATHPKAPRPSRHSSPDPSFQPPNRHSSPFRHSRAEPAPGSIGGGNPRRHPSQGPTPLPSFPPPPVIPAPKPSFPRRACPRLDRGRESTPPPIPRPHAPQSVIYAQPAATVLSSQYPIALHRNLPWERHGTVPVDVQQTQPRNPGKIPIP